MRTPYKLSSLSLGRSFAVRFAFIIIGLAGLVGDIDVGHICCCNHSCLLTMSAMPSPSLGIPIESQRLLRTPGIRNWKCLDKRMEGILLFLIILTMGHVAGLRKDVGADHVISTGDSRSFGGVQLLLVEFDHKRFDCESKHLDVSLRHHFLVG